FCQRAYAQLQLKNYSCKSLILTPNILPKLNPKVLLSGQPVLSVCVYFLRHDWYQTDSQVIITIMVKNAPKDGVIVNFDNRQLSAVVKLPSGEDFSLNMKLLHSIVPQHSTFKVLSTKVEVKMQKTEWIRWEKLEGEGQEPNVKHFIPSQFLSVTHTRNWDKVVGDISEEEKLEGHAVKRAMNKSFVEAGGTVLSTNWTDVGKRTIEMSPPDDMEFKKY
uniref:Suppressor of G2 allele of SKP1 n=1 Tax=Oncorhynchus tshawytscha TaxID=74940 RepID=A0A8C8JYI9_ONCTS